jgi:epoxyqueuosine reductase
LRDALEQLADKLAAIERHQWKVCVDTAPLLERSYARQAGLGWIGRNTCLINEPLGSWFFLGEIVTTLQLQPDQPPPDRCGTCTRCIDACPTQALVPNGDGWTLDARRCISYINIELRGPIPEEQRAWLGSRVFGCDICQEVCPWNARAPETSDPAFQPAYDLAPPLEELAALSPEQFRERFRETPVMRAKYEGLLRNVAAAMEIRE